jgi:hypothetical protein
MAGVSSEVEAGREILSFEEFLIVLIEISDLSLFDTFGKDLYSFEIMEHFRD